MMQQESINLTFYRFQQFNPTPKIELNYHSHFTLLVAIVLSAQTTDVSVNKATDKLFQVADTPEKTLKLGELNLKSYINSIGLHNSKAKNVINLSKKIIENYNSDVPLDFQSLISLPGVGRKSANVFLNSALGLKTIAVDTHVFRVSNRIGLVKANNVLQTEKQLLDVIPDKWLPYAHHWLVLHGRYVCKARKPLCDKCIIRDLCQYDRKQKK